MNKSGKNTRFFLFYKQLHFWVQLLKGFLVFSLKIAYELFSIILF